MACMLLVFSFMWYRFKQKTEKLITRQEEDQRFINQIIKTFAKCIDLRDSQNRGHSFRVAEYTRLIAEELAPLKGFSPRVINEYYNIALLHDIGKLSIPDSILNKPSRLSDEEFELMKSHAMEGEKILQEVNIVKNLAVGAGYHHERMDGKGYPRGISGDEIPEVARIIAVADAFDSMYSTRPYRKRMPLDVVLEELRSNRGTQLDEEAVDALLSLAERGVIK